MSIENLLDSMRRRIPWHVGQKILAEHDVLRGLGWERTIARLTQEKFSEDAEAGIEEAVRQHHQCGEKLVSFFRVDADEMDKLRRQALALAIPRSSFERSYPALLSSDELGTAPREPTLVAREPGEDGVALIFASVRVVTVREPVLVEALSEDAAEALADFDEIVGIRNVRLQAMDVVFIPHDGGHVDLRVDFPKGMHADVASVAAERLRESFNEAMGYDALLLPENLFPVIDRMYRDKDEGYVVELGFGTTTASIKDEKMRRRSADLRKEPYHVGGKGNLASDIEPYRISVAWDRPIGQDRVSSPELSLHGNSRIAASDNPVISSAIVRRCMGVADFEHVRSRIEKHLAAKAKE